MTSDCTPADLTDGFEPGSLYLCMPFSDIPRLGVVLGTIVEALLAHLGSPATPPRFPVLLALDEASNVGKLDGLEQAVSYVQGSGGHQILATFQNLTQVVKVYGPQSPLLSAFGTAVCYTPAAMDTLTAGAIALATGEATVLGRTWGLDTASQTEASRALLTVGDVLRLDQTDAVIFCQGCPPVRARKLGAPAGRRVLVQGALTLRQPLVPVVACGLLGLALAPLWRLWSLAPSPGSPGPAPEPWAMSP
jgi:type IV secretory pathway TraG/TraD family ATPase VirD4